MMNTDWFAPLDLFHPLVYGLASVLGHIFPVWFRFKGGKGVAASFGLLLVYNFWLALIAAMVFLLTEYFTRYVSVSSTVGAITLWLMVTVRHWFITPDGVLWLISGVLVGLILFRHRANYRRLKAGTENRVKLFDPIDRWLERKRG